MNVFVESNETYGRPRITNELRVNGWVVSNNLVARIMGGPELRVRIPKWFKMSIGLKHDYPVAINPLDQKSYIT